MDNGIVYVVIEDSWSKGLGDCPDDWYKLIDSIWDRKEDAKRRIDDLANEYIRRAWYLSSMDPDDFYVKQIWNDDRTVVKNSQDEDEIIWYYIDEVKLNTVEEFTDP